MKLKNIMLTEYILRFPLEIILKIVSFVPNMYLLGFFSVNDKQPIDFLEQIVFHKHKVIYLEWFLTYDTQKLFYYTFQELVICKKIDFRFLEKFQIYCKSLNDEKWEVPLFLFPFMVRYTNKDKTKAEIDDWNRTIEDTDIVNKHFTKIVKQFKKKIVGFKTWQDEAQQYFFKSIKNTNFQFTLESMEENSCFVNYQFTKLHLKTYYSYRGSKCLNNLFNFNKLTKLTIDFLYPNYSIPNWRKLVRNLVCLQLFNLNIGGIRLIDVCLILSIESLKEFNLKTYKRWTQTFWKHFIKKELAKRSTKPFLFRMHFVEN
ncbi:hypothetical protein SBY92_003718 [Candida maltosa Xu316]